MSDLSSTINRKFVESIEIKNWEVYSDTGWVPATHLHKTIKYQEWVVKTESGKELICADDHIVFDSAHNQIFVKDLQKNKSQIVTENGLETVVDVYKTPNSSHMFDLTVDSDNHRFYTNGILSHNTTMVVGYILWYVLFNQDKSVAILANKASTAREILSRIKLAYEALPHWIQQGVKTWNKGDIELENGCRILANSTASSAIRGYSINCVTKETKICVFDEKTDGIYYTELTKVINKSEFVQVKTETRTMYYTVYKTTNTVNGKIYIGYHQTEDLEDGYLGSGKLIKTAVEKYGVDAFKKEILAIFDTKEKAEAYEAQLVNKEFTLREDNYNVAVGGNVQIMYGKNNPFFGKTHSEQVRKKISSIHKGKLQKGNEVVVDGKIFINAKQAQKYLKISRNELIKRAGDPNYSIYFTNSRTQELAKNKFEGLLESKKQKSILCKTRFFGVKKTEEHKLKISNALKGKIMSEEHVNKINKNPEKIRKTAEKHRGMKRSQEAKTRMSMARKGKPSKNKGMVYCYNPLTKEKSICFIEDIPVGWVRGFLPK